MRQIEAQKEVQVKKTKKKPATKRVAVQKKAAAPVGSGAMILKLIGKPNGATLVAIMKATGWQAHSVRGFISTAKKRGIKIESVKNERGERVYHATE
jgi:hypothetical protein